LTACAGWNFYSDRALTTQSGIPIFAPKPYLLVARTGAADKPIEVSVVYLNDPQNVIYAVPRSGIGSADLSLTLADGRLTAFGQTTDTKIPETITSLAGLLTARAEARAAGATGAPGALPTAPDFELYEIVQTSAGPQLKRVAVSGK
jgi:hypothetical protein